MGIRWKDLKAQKTRMSSILCQEDLAGELGSEADTCYAYPADTDVVVSDPEQEYKRVRQAVRRIKREKKLSESVEREATREAQNDRLVESMMLGNTVAQAARDAGVSGSTAANRLRSDEVKAKLNEARNEIESSISIKRLDVMNIFLEAVDMARMMSDPSQMINGADKIARMMGYYEPEQVKVDVSVNYDGALRKIRELSDTQLLELAEGRVIEGVCA
jgi:hypothetical protein